MLSWKEVGIASLASEDIWNTCSNQRLLAGRGHRLITCVQNIVQIILTMCRKWDGEKYDQGQCYKMHSQLLSIKQSVKTWSSWNKCNIRQGRCISSRETAMRWSNNTMEEVKVRYLQERNEMLLRRQVFTKERTRDGKLRPKQRGQRIPKGTKANTMRRLRAYFSVHTKKKKKPFDMKRART